MKTIQPLSHIIKIIETDSKVQNGTVSYSYVAGYLEAVLRGLPDTEDNRQYMNECLNHALNTFGRTVKSLE